MININLEKNNTLWLGGALVVFVWLGLIFNLFHGVDRWFYDHMVDFPGIGHSKTPSVLLVEAEPSVEFAPANTWSEVLKQLARLKAKALVISSLPKNWSGVDKNGVSQDFPVFVGIADGASNFGAQTQNEANLFYGVTQLPPLDGTISRKYWLKSKNATNSNLSLVALTASHLIEDYKLPKRQSFLVDFRAASGKMPVVDMQRLLTGGLIESLVKDRVVLIGFSNSISPQIQTAIGGMSFPMYQAYALDTLLTNNEIRNSHLWVMLLLSLFTVALLLLIVPRIASRFQLFAFLSFMLLTLTTSWLLLMNFAYWIQPGVFIMISATIFVFLYYLRSNLYGAQLRKMALKSATNVEHRWLPQNFFATDEHWTQLVNMVSQTLSLNRTIFLEKQGNDHRVRAIKALNTSLDDIIELRRDFHRQPYTTAIEKGGVLRLEREFLTNGENSEVQYLVPLNFAGELLGFWALSVSTEHHLEEKKIVYAVEQFASQISEMLFHRSQWLTHQQYQKKPWVKLLSMQFDESAYSAINRSINFMAQRLSVMEAVMDGMGTSAVLYDLFGRVVQVNDAMSATLSKVELAPYAISAADLISQLSSCSLGDARNYLSYIILEKGTINLPVNHPAIEKGYLLSVKSLLNKEGQSVEEGDVHPFEIIGILCELVDMSRISEIYLQKEKVVEHLSSWLRNDLSSISIACDLAKDERMDVAKKHKLMGMIKDKVGTLGESIERVNEIIQSDLVSQITAYHPVDCHKIILQSIKNISKTLTKGVQIETHFPFYLPLVVASPNELRKIFDELLTMLCNDAVEDGKVLVEILSENSALEFHFSNVGFGIPNELLQSYLEDNSVLDSQQFIALRVIKHQLERWGGIFVAHSDVGEGMRFTFKLESFYPK